MFATIKIRPVGDRLLSHAASIYRGSIDLHDEGNETLLRYCSNACVTELDGRTGCWLKRISVISCDVLRSVIGARRFSPLS